MTRAVRIKGSEVRVGDVIRIVPDGRWERVDRIVEAADRRRVVAMASGTERSIANNGEYDVIVAES